MPANARTSVLILCLCAWAVAAWAAEKEGDCDPRARKRVQAEATRLSREKKHSEAARVVSEYVDGCPLEDDADFWLLRDLGRALFRAGELLECRRRLAPLFYPGPEVGPLVEAGLEGSEVEEALEQILGQCTQEQERARVALRADACPFSVSPQPAAVIALDTGSLSPGAARGCLVLTEPSTDAGRNECPQLLVVEEDAAGTRRSRPLKSSGDRQDPLASQDRCCLARTLRLGAPEGRRRVLVGGQGRACGGGNAVEELVVFYEWSEGDALKLVKDASVVLRRD